MTEVSRRGSDKGWAREFVRSQTSIQSLPLLPEMRLHLAGEVFALWKQSQEAMHVDEAPMPFWAFAWSGGQALARYLLDHPELVEGREVLDVGSGSGVVAIAALLAGASRATVVEQDVIARSAIQLNAEINGVMVETILDELPPLSSVKGVILAGDVFYDQESASSFGPYLLSAAREGRSVLIGDPGRSFLPVENLERLAIYEVPVMKVVEAGETRAGEIWTVRV